MARTLAPTLRASLHYIPGRAGTRRDAERQLRALLAVARAAAVWDDGLCWTAEAEGAECGTCPQCKLTRALGRLRRAGGKR